MDDVLKYIRLQDKVLELFTRDKISASAIESDIVVFGTDDGFVHILNYSGSLVNSMRLFTSRVNDISLDIDGGTLACCCDSGAVTIISIGTEDDKGMTIQHNEPIKCVCLEGEMNTKKDKSFITGSVSGRLIHHKLHRHNHKKSLTLFTGSGSSVLSIAWHKNYLAWSDAAHVRVMDTDTQTAICYLSAPVGVGIHNPFPCHLFWESDNSLLIGWADRFRQLELIRTTGNLLDDREIIARTACDWTTDCIIAGLSTFDVDHLIIVGYVPPDEQEMDIEQLHSAPDNSPTSVPLSKSNRPEVQLVQKSNGEVVSCDILPLRGPTMEGPWAYHLLSSYFCRDQRMWAQQWRLLDSRERRGGDRGFSPFFFLCSPRDVVGIRVRNVNDRIGLALKHHDVALAVNLACQDRSSLRQYRYGDLVQLYLEDLLDPNNPDGNLGVQLAAKECARLLGADGSLWEQWISNFAQRKLLSYLAPYIPTQSPRLPQSLYEFVLETLYSTDQRVLRRVMERWGRLESGSMTTGAVNGVNNNSNSLFDHSKWRQRLETAKELSSDLTEILALLYIWSRQYSKAIVCFLKITYPESTESSSLLSNMSNGSKGSSFSLSSSNNQSSGSLDTVTYLNPTQDSHEDVNRLDRSNARQEDRSIYVQVFELIEKENRFKDAEDKVMNLIRLSPELAASLLVRRADKFPVASVVKQLRGDRRVLHWYLHTMFTKFESYNMDPEYSEFHALQVALYAEFTPDYVRPYKKLPLKSNDEVTNLAISSKNMVNNNSNSNSLKGGKSTSTSGINNNNNNTSLKANKKGNVMVDNPPLSRRSLSRAASVEKTNEEAEKERLELLKIADEIRQQEEKEEKEKDSLSYLLNLQKKKDIESDFMVFLKTSKFYPVDLALKECQKRSPPLYPEMIYLLDMKNMHRKALDLFIRYIGDVAQIVDFVESHEEGVQEELWNDVVEYSVENSDFLASLLDFIGLCQLHPVSVFHRMPYGTNIPRLRQKLLRIFRQYHYQVSALNLCNGILENDALDSLRRRNQGQRRAMTIRPQSRCFACSRPLFMNAAPESVDVERVLENGHGILATLVSRDPKKAAISGLEITKSNNTASANSNSTMNGNNLSNGLTKSLDIKLWGQCQLAHGGVIAISNRQQYHRTCFEKIHQHALATLNMSDFVA